MPRGMRTAPVSRKRVLMARVMGSGAYVTSAITRLISLEVVEGFRSTLRQWSVVAVMGIEAIVDMAVKAMRAMEPRTGSNKHPANKPIGPVITVRSTVIRGIVEVTVRAHGSRPDVYADRNLGLHHRRTAQETSYQSCESKHTDFEHDFPLIR